MKSSITDQERRRLIELLSRAYADATMSNSAFDHICIEAGEDLPKSEKEVTAFIRNRTDLWRRSWILSPLEDALSILTEGMM